MKVTIEISAKELRYNLWSGAIDTLNSLTDEEIEIIISILEDAYDGKLSLTDLNDFFWFERDTIAEWLGYEDFEKILEKNI